MQRDVRSPVHVFASKTNAKRVFSKRLIIIFFVSYLLHLFYFFPGGVLCRFPQFIHRRVDNLHTPPPENNKINTPLRGSFVPNAHFPAPIRPADAFYAQERLRTRFAHLHASWGNVVRLCSFPEGNTQPRLQCAETYTYCQTFRVEPFAVARAVKVCLVAGKRNQCVSKLTVETPGVTNSL